MDAIAFEKLVLTHFPCLREDFEDWNDLLHLQVMEFARFTQSAIETESLDVVSECFRIANSALIEGNDDLSNAIHVSYLEHLEFGSEAGKRAAKLLPPELKEGRDAILAMTRSYSVKSCEMTTDEQTVIQ
jgi:hypothetical protein